MGRWGRGLKQRAVSARLEPSEPSEGSWWDRVGHVEPVRLGRAWLLRGADGALLGSFLKEEPSWILVRRSPGHPLTDLRGAGGGGRPGPWEPLLDPSPPTPRWATS